MKLDLTNYILLNIGENPSDVNAFARDVLLVFRKYGITMENLDEATRLIYDVVCADLNGFGQIFENPTKSYAKSKLKHL